MLVIVGSLIVTVCVFGGFALAGGNLLVLWQPIELIIIFGSAIGGLVISSPVPLIKEIIRQVLHTLSAKGISQQEYMEVLLLMYEITKTAKANPLSLEAHVEKPEASAIFSKYPNILKNHHAIHFITDTLKVQISSPLNPYDLEELMDRDIGAAHADELKAPATVSRVGDAMPGLGIVAAVLGVVLTMGKLSMGKEVIGNSVAAALVGTFLGILISYGYMQPLSAKMEGILGDEGKYIDVMKAALLAYAKDCSPKVCVEFARRSIPPANRPSFEEVDKATSSMKAA